MIRYIFLILLILPSCLFGQKQDEAIILENKVFVYSKANYSSDTIYVLQKNEIFLLAENQDNNSEWVQIEISQNRLSKITDLMKGFYITGFILRNKIYIVDSLPYHETNEIALKFRIKKADTSKKIEDNNIRYGLEIPLDESYVVNEMLIDWKGELIKQDKIYFDDLYNISANVGVYSGKQNERFSIYKHDDVFFIKQEAGDGAGFYEITWVIKDGIIIQRLIDEI